MNPSFNVDISQVLGVFDSILNRRERKNILVASKRAAGNVIAKEAYKLAPVDTGQLKRSLRKLKDAVKVTNRIKNVYVRARAVDSKGRPYANVVEFGRRRKGRSKPRFLLKGRKISQSKPVEFMTEAAENATKEAYNAFKNKFVERLYATIKRKAGRTRR